MTKSDNNAKVFSLDCPKCGSALNLFGGHRVRTVTCRACGSCLDIQNEYSVVGEFFSKKRPKMSIKLGMTGKFKGVEFTVIGIIRWKGQSDGERYQAYDFQLFSPTHGYAWLRREDFHFLFIREVKDMPDSEVSFNSPVRSTKFKVRDRKFTLLEKGVETIDYVEGELTWIAKNGDKSRYLTAAAPPYLYEISKSDDELEFAFGEYMPPQEVYDAFKIKSKPVKPMGVHIAQEYSPNPIVRFSKFAVLFVILSLLIVILIEVFGTGKKVFQQTFSTKSFADGVDSKTFKVTDPSALMYIELSCPFDNAWGYFDVSVRKGETEYLNMSHEISYYHGYEGGESWSEGSQSTGRYFRLPEAGDYQINVWGEGGTGNTGKGIQSKNLRVTISEGVIVSRYFIILTVIFFMIALIYIINKLNFHKERLGIEFESN